MEPIILITLPDAAAGEVRGLQDDLRALDGVVATSTATRSIEPVRARAWVQLADAAAGGPALGRVVAAISARGISGARLRVPDGTEISVDSATTEELENLDMRLRQGAPPR